MKQPVIVIGAGWSGLTAALALAERGEPVIVLEAAPISGGRARSIDHGGRIHDNGQHLLLCACTRVIERITRLGLDPEQAFLRLPLQLRMHRPAAECLELGTSRRPWPLHLIEGLVRARGIALPERFAFAACLPDILFNTPSEESTVQEWLDGLAQPPSLCRRLWHALCVSALNTDPEQASARLFARVLRETFRPPARRADLWIPRRPLSAIFPEPAVHRIRRLGGQVRFRHRAVALESRAGQWRVQCRNGARFEGRMILATPPWAAARLLAGIPGTGALCRRLERLVPSPIPTLWLEYPEPPPLPAPLIGLEAAPYQFVFDHTPLGARGRLALVASGPAANRALDAMDSPARRAHALLRERCTGWPATEPVAWQVRERRATFLATPEAERARPGADCGLPGLMLAGDWTATSLPATLESAVRSGETAAELAYRQRPV
ncbi:MAG TPA: FAD-dependent oxidoreductase [Thiotrichales bacterium]|nr:FAD-dependent oxidoreductase [Thiotrichales bacterium]